MDLNPSPLQSNESDLCIHWTALLPRDSDFVARRCSKSEVQKGLTNVTIPSPTQVKSHEEFETNYR